MILNINIEKETQMPKLRNVQTAKMLFVILDQYKPSVAIKLFSPWTTKSTAIPINISGAISNNLFIIEQATHINFELQVLHKLKIF